MEWKLKFPKIQKHDYITITLILMFAAEFMERMLHFNSVVYFLSDIPIIIMLIQYKHRLKHVLLKRKILWLSFFFLFMVVIALVGVLVNRVPIANMIYGIYKYFRGFIFFFCCICCLNDRSIKSTVSVIKYIFWINVLFTAVQFFVLGLRQDDLGGVFGTTVGVNQYTNLFFVVISIYLISATFSRKLKLTATFKFLIPMLLIAAVAEIKYFYIEFFILCAFAFICEKKNIKTITAIIVLFIGTVLSYNLLILYFPQFANLMEVLKTGGVSKLISLQRHYSTDSDIGRAVIFQYSNEYYLQTLSQRLFGLGIGKIASSNLIDNSFYYSNFVSHYDQFFTSYLYIEQGIIGFISYILFMVYFLKNGIQRLIKSETTFLSLMLVLSFMGWILMFVYNMSLQGNMNLLMFWLLAVLVYMHINNKVSDNIH